MAERDDGGAAFPTNETEKLHPQMGMSLRDWFAGQALAGKCGMQADQWAEPEVLAVRAYKMADAMLAARKGERES